jgi:uncharacterized RDD family membrane protein YckC
MQNPPPPPPPSSGPPPMMPPPGGGYAMAAPAGNLASPGLRIVGGLIDAIILFVVLIIINILITHDKQGFITLPIDLILITAYQSYFVSSRGQTIGMMVFGFKVRDIATGQFPTLGKAALRGFIWALELQFTVCIIGAIGWLWQLWDPQKQAIHDKVGGTIVTTS